MPQIPNTNLTLSEEEIENVVFFANNRQSYKMSDEEREQELKKSNIYTGQSAIRLIEELYGDSGIPAPTFPNRWGM